MSKVQSLRPTATMLFLIVSLFFLWGMANNLNDILIKHFKKSFELSDFRAGLVQSAFYFGYFCFAIPAGLFMRRWGYKGAIVLGLLLFAVGLLLFYPAAQLHAYPFFLLALYVIASGLAFLETSANPLMTVLGDPSGAAKRLNLAQAFNPLGSITGVVIGQNFILSGVEPTASQFAAMNPLERQQFLIGEAHSVQAPYLVMGIVVLVWALMTLATSFPRTEQLSETDAPRGPLQVILRDATFMQSVVAQFCYVGAQVGVWSYLIRYAQSTIPGTPEKLAANFLTASLIAFALGRFAGAALLRYVRPDGLLAAYAAVNIVLCGVSVALPGVYGLYSLVACSFFMSVMFPTIFALGLTGLDDSARKIASSLLVMSIIGGAILTALMGGVSDAFGIHRSMLVPLGCFGFIFLFAYRLPAARERMASAGDSFNRDCVSMPPLSESDGLATKRDASPQRNRAP